MADTFKKSEIPPPPSDLEDVWKDTQVERGHQPDEVKSTLTYRQMEEEMEYFNGRIASLTKEKEVLEAEMIKVKTITEK